MKFAELKNRFQNKYVIRVIAGVLMVAVLGTGLGAWRVQAAKETSTETVSEAEDSGDGEDEASADTENMTEEQEREALKDQLGTLVHAEKNETEIGKDETVYMIADASGNVEKTIVSDWLKNPDGSDTLKDASDLTDITNVKGDETFTQDGESITWKAEGSDIFYQGTATKEAPVSQSITYYLDGQEIAPEDLAGKSGKVTIRFDYTNNARTTETIQGKSCDIYVPFTVMTGMILNDNFSNVEVTNGKVITDGKNTIVAGIAMPGLKESLGVTEDDFDEDVTLPDYVEVTADVEDFELGMTISVASADLLSQMNVNGSLDLSVLSDTIAAMTEASGQLAEGSNELAEGLDTLQTSLNQFSAGVNTAQSGVKDYTDGAAKLAAGANDLNTGIGTLASSAPTLTNGVSNLLTGVQAAGNGAAQIDAGVTQLVDGIGTMKTTVSDSITAISQGATIYQTDAEAQQAFAGALTSYTTASATYLGMLQQFTTPGGSLNAYAGALTPVDATISLYRVDDTTNAGILAATGMDFNALGNTYASELANLTAVVNNIGASGKVGALSQVQNGLAQFDDTQLSALKAGASGLNAGLNGDQGIVAGVTTLNNSVSGDLSNGIHQLTAGAQQLADGAAELTANNEKLNSGMTSLRSATDLLVNGVAQLESGSNDLAEGMAQFDEEAIGKIADAYNGDVKELLERLEAVVAAGEDYGTFTRTADGVKGSVKFVWETASIQTED